jgi:hypothetical protein
MDKFGVRSHAIKFEHFVFVSDDERETRGEEKGEEEEGGEEETAGRKVTSFRCGRFD